MYLQLLELAENSVLREAREKIRASSEFESFGFAQDLQ